MSVDPIHLAIVNEYGFWNRKKEPWIQAAVADPGEVPRDRR